MGRSPVTCIGEQLKAHEFLLFPSQISLLSDVGSVSKKIEFAIELPLTRQSVLKTGWIRLTADSPQSLLISAYLQSKDSVLRVVYQGFGIRKSFPQLCRELALFCSLETTFSASSCCQVAITLYNFCTTRNRTKNAEELSTLTSNRH